MFRASKNTNAMAVIITAIVLFYGFSPAGISPRLRQKLDNAVESTFEIDTFRLKWVEVDAEKDTRAELDFRGQHFFKILRGDSLIGYGYLGQAPSKKDVFDYVVLLDPDLTIKKSKILIYREDFGRQIGSQRWLVQFAGLTKDDTPVYGENIDAISGATISASSMTRAVAGVLEGIRILKDDLIQ